ncbi:unnamed protein product, partial [Amoebophrya sp. A120]
GQSKLQLTCVAKTASVGEWVFDDKSMNEKDLKCVPVSDYCPDLRGFVSATKQIASQLDTTAVIKQQSWRGRSLPEEWAEREYFTDSVYQLKCKTGLELVPVLQTATTSGGGTTAATAGDERTLATGPGLNSAVLSFETTVECNER